MTDPRDIPEEAVEAAFAAFIDRNMYSLRTRMEFAIRAALPFLSAERDAAVARAEAADEDLRDLVANLDFLGERAERFEAERDAAVARAERAEAERDRLAEALNQYLTAANEGLRKARVVLADVTTDEGGPDDRD